MGRSSANYSIIKVIAPAGKEARLTVAIESAEGFDKYVEDVEFLLRNVAFIVRQRGREILRDFDITPPQFTALLILYKHPNSTMGELCSHIYLASSTVTDLIDRMEQNGYVSRERDPSDRRVVRLKVQPKGLDMIRRVMEARKAYLSATLSHIEEDQRAQLKDVLQQLYDVMMAERVQRRR